MISLPPHTTHRMQPLDVAFCGPLKTYYGQAVNNPGKVITDRSIEPYNPDIFSNLDYAPACVSERPFSVGRTETEDADWNSSDDEPLINLQIPPTNTEITTDRDCPTNATPEITTDRDCPTNATPGPSCVGNDTTDRDCPTNATPGPSCVGNDTMRFRSPWQIRALPKYDRPPSNTRKKQKCNILTSTPVKEQLEQKEKEQRTKETGKKGNNELCEVNLQLANEPKKPLKFRNQAPKTTIT
ncbi:hypothetical protein QE152_g798 [Popillia japonica]|uniref:Uncharacterized protein n=1 Tax=Popillia japonica TaxID=7064 RepID=A0AAW1NAD3_POPJA